MNTTTLTPAQDLRLARVLKDVTATGGRITTRKLPGGQIRITEYVKGQRRGEASVVMDLDGFYL